MKEYSIIILSKAQYDIAECVGFVLNVSKDAAISLMNDIYSSIETLKTFPERNPLFVMPSSFPYPIRKQIINHRYIALYSIEDDHVIVHRLIDSRRRFNYLLS